MSDSVLPQWLVSLGEALGTSGGALWFLVNRYDRLVDGAKKDHADAMLGVEKAKNDSADALQAVIARFDSRHESLRQEMSGKVDQLAGRIDAQTRDMATRHDVQTLTNAVNKLSERIDNRLDRTFPK